VVALEMTRRCGTFSALRNISSAATRRNQEPRI
jgi:hypothetical protein